MHIRLTGEAGRSQSVTPTRRGGESQDSTRFGQNDRAIVKIKWGPRAKDAGELFGMVSAEKLEICIASAISASDTTRWRAWSSWVKRFFVNVNANPLPSLPPIPSLGTCWIWSNNTRDWGCIYEDSWIQLHSTRCLEAWIYCTEKECYQQSNLDEKWVIHWSVKFITFR